MQPASFACYFDLKTVFYTKVKKNLLPVLHIFMSFKPNFSLFSLQRLLVFVFLNINILPFMLLNEINADAELPIYTLAHQAYRIPQSFLSFQQDLTKQEGMKKLENSLPFFSFANLQVYEVDWIFVYWLLYTWSTVGYEAVGSPTISVSEPGFLQSPNISSNKFVIEFILISKGRPNLQKPNYIIFSCQNERHHLC